MNKKYKVSPEYIRLFLGLLHEGIDSKLEDLSGLNLVNRDSVKRLVKEYLYPEYQNFTISTQFRIKESLRFGLNFWTEERLHKYEYTEFNDEKNLFFYKNNKMLNSHLKKGYHLNKNGEGCFGLEGKRVTMNQVVSLYKFDGLSDFEPYDINLIFEKAYYYLLVLPEPIETSKFSKEIFDLFSDALNSK